MFTVVAVVVSFAWLAVEDPSKWKTGVALYVIGCPYFFYYLKDFNSYLLAFSDCVPGKKLYHHLASLLIYQNTFQGCLDVLDGSIPWSRP